MDIGNSVAQLNYLAIVIAAVANFGVGSIWYSKILFGDVWMRANGFSEEENENVNMGLLFAKAFVLILISAFILAMFIGPEGTLVTGLMAGFFVGFGWVATSLGVIDLFEQRPTAHFLVNSGYHLVAFMVMGLILGAW